jgi:hypothetical protein
VTDHPDPVLRLLELADRGVRLQLPLDLESGRVLDYCQHHGLIRREIKYGPEPPLPKESRKPAGGLAVGDILLANGRNANEVVVVRHEDDEVHVQEAGCWPCVYPSGEEVTVLDGPIPVRATWEEMALTPAGKEALLDHQLRPRTRTRRSTGVTAPRPKAKARRAGGEASMPAAAKRTRAGRAKADPTPVVVERVSLEVFDDLGRLMRPPVPAATLTDTDRSILIVLNACGKPLSYARIANESVAMERQDRTKQPEERSGVRRLSDSAIRARVRVLLWLGYVGRPAETKKKGVAITEAGRQAL